MKKNSNLLATRATWSVHRQENYLLPGFPTPVNKLNWGSEPLVSALAQVSYLFSWSKTIEQNTGIETRWKHPLKSNFQRTTILWKRQSSCICIEQTSDEISLSERWKDKGEFFPMVQISTISSIQPHVLCCLVVLITYWITWHSNTDALVPFNIFSYKILKFEFYNINNKHVTFKAPPLIDSFLFTNFDMFQEVQWLKIWKPVKPQQSTLALEGQYSFISIT